MGETPATLATSIKVRAGVPEEGPEAVFDDFLAITFEANNEAERHLNGLHFSCMRSRV